MTPPPLAFVDNTFHTFMHMPVWRHLVLPLRPLPVRPEIAMATRCTYSAAGGGGGADRRDHGGRVDDDCDFDCDNSGGTVDHAVHVAM